jgi:hypothetical protein
MNNRIEVFISQDNLEKIKKKKIGQGREGKIYKINNNLLYKIYYKLDPHEREEIVHVCLKEYEVDEDGVKKVKDNAKKVNVEEVIYVKPYYVDNEGVRKIYSIDQIDEAIKRQQNIKQTSLPLGPIYIDNRLGGVVLKYHKGYFNFHIISMLSQKLRLEMLKIVLEKLKELCDNNIYPIDYANQSDGPHPHSNILINIKEDVQFIDLEGKSTMYTKDSSRYYESIAYAEFYFLVLDIMYGEKLSEEMSEEDLEYMENYLKERGFDEGYIKYLRNPYNLNYDISKGLLDTCKIKSKSK